MTKREVLVLIPAVIVTSAGFIAQSSINVAIPRLQVTFDIGAQGLVWLVNAFGLPVGALLPLSGALSDRFGLRRVFLSGMVFFLAGSILSAAAVSGAMFYASRAVQGIGGGLMIPGSLAILTRMIAAERRGQAIGIWSAFTAVTALAGPALGGFLVQYVSWRWLFWMYVPLLLPAIALVIWKVPPLPGEGGSLDWGGATLLLVATTAVTFGITRLNDGTWPILVIGILLVPLFVFWERRAPDPLVSMEALTHREFMSLNLRTVLLYGALATMGFFLTIDLIVVRGYGETAAGLAYVPSIAAIALLSGPVGRWSDRIGTDMFLRLGPGLVAVAFLYLSLVPPLPGSSKLVDYLVTVLPGTLLEGIGMGFTAAPITRAVMGSLPEKRSGIASGINNTASRLAGVLFLAIAGAASIPLFQARVLAELPVSELPASLQATVGESLRDLANSQPPDGLSRAVVDAWQPAVNSAFLTVKGMIFFVCALLAGITAAWPRARKVERT